MSYQHQIKVKKIFRYIISLINTFIIRKRLHAEVKELCEDG